MKHFTLREDEDGNTWFIPKDVRPTFMEELDNAYDILYETGDDSSVNQLLYEVNAQYVDITGALHRFKI